MLAFCGKHDLLIKSVDLNCGSDSYTAACAAYAGNVEILDWLHSNSKNYFCDFDEICRNAVKNGKINVLEWIKTHQRGFKGAVYEAIRHNQFGVLDWLSDQGYVRNIDVNIDVFSGLHCGVGILNWLKKHNYELRISNDQT